MAAGSGGPAVPRLDNFMKDRLAVTATTDRYLTYMSYLEALVGICRVRGARILRFTLSLYGFALAAGVAVLAADHQPGDNASYVVFRRTASVEFALLVAAASLCHRRSAAALDRELARVELAIDPDGERGLATEMTWRGCVWVVLNLTYYAIEYCVVVMWRRENIELGTLVLYVPLLAHDLEQLYFTSLLRMICVRLEVLRGQLPQALAASVPRPTPPPGAPRRHPPLDITALHRLYERLHRCAELLNSIMSLPMFIMLIASGISTTFLLKNLVTALQVTDAASVVRGEDAGAPLVYGVLRCAKYALSVFVPCVYSGLTAVQARALRTQAHDALDDKPLVSERTGRRKLKALVRLTRERDFTYALWGVVALDMSLPLSYVSLCTTYLVIVIQFSKFID